MRKVLFGVGHTLGPVGAASVLVWVGLWGLLDHFLFPQDTVLSAVTCIIFATGFAVLCHIVSPSLLSDNNNNNNSVAFTILAACLGVCYWRGVWKLWESVVFADNPLAQSLLAVTLGVTILMLTGNFQHTVVGPPILFPLSSSGSQGTLKNDTLVDGEDRLEPMIVMTTFKDGSE